PIAVEYLEVKDHLELDDQVYALPLGVHVLVVRTLYGGTAGSFPALPHDGTVPSGTQLLLVNRSAAHAPRRDSLGGFTQVPHIHRAWLILTPFSVVGDIVTFPFQLIGI